MQNILTRRSDETFSDNWIGTETLNALNQVLILTGQTINGVINIISISQTIAGESDNVYLKKFFKFREPNCGITNWSKEISLDLITGMTFSDTTDLDLELIYYYVYDNPTLSATDITISNISVNGNFQYGIIDSVVNLTGQTEIILQSSTDLYKIFKLTTFQVQGRNLSTSSFDIKYRFTQDGGRTFSTWESLTTANISTYRFDELRFCQVQYLITNYGDSLNIYDIILIGDFQNVSANYLKTNQYGIKQDCATYYETLLGNNSFYANFDTQGLSCYCQL